MRRLVIEVRGGNVQKAYWEGTPHCLLNGGRVVLRDWDNIQAGDPDPLTVASYTDHGRLFCRNCGLAVEEDQPFQPWGRDWFIHDSCTQPDPKTFFCQVHGHALMILDEHMGLCPVPSHPPRECAQYHPLNPDGEAEEEE